MSLTIKSVNGDYSFNLTTTEEQALDYTYDVRNNIDGDMVADLIFEAKQSSAQSGFVVTSVFIYLSDPVPSCKEQSLVLTFNIDPPKSYITMDYFSSFRFLMGHHWMRMYNSSSERMNEDISNWRKNGVGYGSSFLEQLKKRHKEVMDFRNITLSDGSIAEVRNTNCSTRNGLNSNSFCPFVKFTVENDTPKQSVPGIVVGT